MLFCGKTKIQFVSAIIQKVGDLVRSVNTVTSGIKLPWTKFPGEMNLAGHSFMGPGTNLRKTLKPDLTSKHWSEPINRVDRATYYHKLAYAKQNGLQLNPDKSEALIVGTANQLRAVTSSVPCVSVAGVDLPVADDMKVLGVVLDRRLTFHKHVTMVARLCNYHAQAI